MCHLRGDPARLLASLGAAHPVGNQAELRGRAARQLDLAGVNRVLVVLPHPPQIGASGDLEAQRHRRHLLCSLFRRAGEQRPTALAKFRAGPIAAPADRAADLEGAQHRQPRRDPHGLAPLRELLREAVQDARQFLDRLGGALARGRVGAGELDLPPTYA